MAKQTIQIGIDFNQPSTWRGLIMVIGAIFIGIAYLNGKDVAPIITLIFGANGGVGLLLKDNQ